MPLSLMNRLSQTVPASLIRVCCFQTLDIVFPNVCCFVLFCFLFFFFFFFFFSAIFFFFFFFFSATDSSDIKS